ncbi:MAG: NADH-quinone oxidoreductase subunit L [Chloroflexi bacterium]|nr:NADH-quinone oxidoreductase subunit L [Chloroflexota bacterium]
MTESAAWAILFLPLAAFLLNGLVIRPFLNRWAELAGYVTIAAIGGSFLLSLWALQQVVAGHGEIGWASHEWVTVGSLKVHVGILMDPLTAIMLVVVTGVSLAVQVYSVGYMHGDRGYVRYYAYMSLFTASMVGLVLASSVLQMFVFWELVGLSSYLLIGFWYHRPSAARAAVKAFVVTRLGDLGFLIAILYLFFHQGAFDGAGLNALEVRDVYTAVGAGLLGSTAVTWLAVGFFAGAVGKSAQFPLHVWLPDAMEGPTPVSALIHAATMVAAGVFLVARMFPVFEASDAAMNLVAITGGVTAVLAATMAITANDIKRVVAYSTISQLGYMMLALGVGAYGAAMFHLFNHAFFKALLFLGAGSVNHAAGTFDMRWMGGLRRVQPWTYALFLVGALSLAGVFPLAGFWSKDEILAEAFHEGSGVALLVFLLALAAAFMTAFYIFRAPFLTFHGTYRGGVERKANDAANPDTETMLAADEAEWVAAHDTHHAGESPWSMVVPMAALGVLAVASGFVANAPFALPGIAAHWFSEFLFPPGGHGEAPKVELWVAALSMVLALAGIGLAWLVYGARSIAPEKLTIRPLYLLTVRKYYLDDLYERFLTGKVFYDLGVGCLDWFDRVIVDGVADNVAWVSRSVGRGLGALQTGQVQVYGFLFVFGAGVILLVYLLR